MSVTLARRGLRPRRFPPYSPPGTAPAVPGSSVAHGRSVSMTQTRRDFWYGVAVLAMLCVAGGGRASAQDAVIKGRVISDRGEAMAGANVFIEELRIAT